MQTDTLIIGGGLAGLRLADLLGEAGLDYQLFEARNRLGGRILTHSFDGVTADLGPAWFWPGQPRIGALLQSQGLRKFDQHAEGHPVFEDERGQIQRVPGYASMGGSMRVKDGLGSLISALASKSDPSRLHLGLGVTSLTSVGSGVTATLSDSTHVTASRVVIAMPPRLVADTIVFKPSLPGSTISSLRSIPTWMAGQAKAVAIYDQPFWRSEGLSGDAISRRGPMVEIHDASPATGSAGALFGFIGVPPEARRDEARLRAAVTAQFERLFGAAAGNPRTLMLKDWADDPHTAAVDDARPLRAHPRYGLPSELRGLWDGKLMFGSSEVAPEFGGYLEGALEAAEAVMTQISRQAEMGRM